MKIKPTDRVSTVKEYYLQRKMKEVAALNSQGFDIISLGIGGPDMMPPQTAIETLCSEVRKDDTHSYQLGIGIPQLRESFSQWYHRKYNVKIDPATEILPLSGSKEGIMHISMTFLNPEDGVLVPDPGYPTYSSVSNLVGAEIFKYDLTAESGWMPDFEAIEKLPLERIKLMWLNYPHMPTGTPARHEIFEKAIEFGRKHNIVIVNDNPYSFILNDNPLSIMQISGAKDIAIELNSLSKSHNMAGWRMGMVTSNSDFIQWILKVKSNIDSGQFKPVMQAAAAALNVDDSWYTALNEKYAKRRKAAEKVMEALGCTIDPDQRGLFLWGRIPDNEKNGESLADRILLRAKVFITPGFIFGKNGDRYVRISLCAPEEKLDEAAERILKSKNNTI